MKKKAYLEPAFRIVYLNAYCESELMDGSAQWDFNGDDTISDDDDDDGKGTRHFEFGWD